MTHTIQALLFDMDGLLLDTEGVYILVYADLSKRLGCPQTPEYFKQFIGKSAHATCSDLHRMLNYAGSVEDLMAQESALYFEFIRKHKPAPFPGVRELFEYGDHKGLKRGLVSSTIGPKVDPAIEAVMQHLKRHGNWRNHFHTVCTGDRCPNLKPAPDLYLTAAAELGLKPQQCVAFEDSVAGIGAARAAGCRVVAIPNIHLSGVDVSQGRADFVFNTLLEAYASIERILN